MICAVIDMICGFLFDILPDGGFGEQVVDFVCDLWWCTIFGCGA